MIGEIDKCPYCKKKLIKIPERKKKCDFCNKFIYVRTRPNDYKKVLIKEDQIKVMEEEWIKLAINSYWFKELQKYGATKEKFIKMYQTLRERFGTTPLISDVLWGEFNNVWLECLKQNLLKEADSIKVLMDKFKTKEKEGKDLWAF